MPSIDKKYYHNIDLARNELKAGKIYNLNTVDRLALSLNTTDKGFVVYDITLLSLYIWNGTSWTTAAGGVGSLSATGPITVSASTGAVSISTAMSSNKLIGRSSSGTGVMEEITVGTGLTLSSGTLSATSTGIPHATASGTDTYTTTITGVTAYTDGDAYIIQFTNGNTDASTLNINSLGARSLYRNNDGSIIGGDIVAGGEMLCVYDNTITGFRLIGTSPNTLYAYVVNADSVTITRGQPVYAFGSTGNRMSVKLAYNTTDSTSAQTYGLVYSSSIAANQKGIIIIQGVLDGLNLGGTWVDGDPVYLGSTAGSLTKTKPYAPNHLVYLGVVERANAGNGIMYVRVQNGYELDELHNVQATAPTTNDVLYYFGSNQWKTASISTILGYTPIQLTSLSASSPLSYNNLTGAFSIQDAAADGSTKGAATFTASDFNAISGVISIDYTNGQAASSSTKGFLTSTDWSTFNNKQNALTNPVTGTGTNNELAYFNTTGSTLASLSTTTYPSLTELSYVKGVTSSIQTQLNSKQGTLTLTTTGSSGSATFTTNTLNIPTYTLAGLGGQASSTNLTSLSGLTFVSTSFVKMTAAGTFALDTNTYYLASNPSGYTNNTGTVTSVAALTLGTTGTDLSSTVATGTTTPVITLNVPTASATNRGALSSADWSTFNGKQGAITLTTTGTSGAATLIGNTLNIPQYSGGGGGGTVTSVSVTSANGFAGTVANATTTPAITLTTTVTGLLKGNGTAISAAVAGTDYLVSNQTITLSGDISGSGTTTISTSLATQAGVTTGTYNSATQITPITIDSKGRITNTGTTVTIAPLFSSIASKPTTLSGYGITDALSTSSTTSVLTSFGTNPNLNNPLLTSISTVGGGGLEGGQINFARVTDGTGYWFIDSYGSTASPDLRIVESTIERFKFGAGGAFYVGGSAGTSGQVLTSAGVGASPTWTSALTNPMTTAGDIIYGGASGTATRLAGSGTNGWVLTYDTATNAPKWAASSGGGGTPGGSNTQIQYNNSGAFAGSVNFVWDDTNIRLGIGQATPTSRFHLNTNSIGVSQSDANGILLANSTLAAAGAQQQSPAIVWQGNGWKTNATAGSQDVRFRADVLPLQGAASPTAEWQLSSSIAGGAYSPRLRVDSSSSVYASAFYGTNWNANNGIVAGTSQFIAGNNSFGNIFHRLVNNGATFTPLCTVGYPTSTGTVNIGIDRFNGIVFGQVNQNSQIVTAAAIQVVNLQNASAGSEAGDLAFYTQSGGTAITEKWRITSTGLLGNNTTSITSALQINKNQNSVTQADANGILLANSMAATVGLQSISPAIVWQGNGWQTSTGSSQDVRFRADVLPVQGFTNPTATWQLGSSVNNAAYSNSLTYTSGGVLTVPNVIQTGGGTGVIAAGAQLLGGLTSTATKFFRLTSPSGTAVTPVFAVGAGFGSGTTGAVSMAFDATYHITLLANNASSLNTPRASIQITNLTNTAGAEAGDLIFLTQSGGTAISEKMRIFAAGNVGINTGSTNGGYKFDVNGTGRFQNVLTTTGRVHANSRKTSAYTLTTLDKIIFADLATTAFTLTLPNHVAGTEYTIIKSDSTANLLTVNTTSGLINSSSTWTASAQYKFITVVSDGTNWFITAGG